jgi:type IV secretion system protein VirB6
VIAACPAILPGGDAGLAAGIGALDCQINAAVTLGYGRLFGQGGAFGAALTTLLTVYVAFIAYGLITGRTRLTLPTMTPKILALGLVLTFATAWPAYQAMVYDLLTKGPDQVASAFLGAHGGATQAFAGRLDALFAQVAEVAQAVGALGHGPSGDGQVAVKLVWASAITLLVSTVGLLVVSRIVLAVLLALGPVFIVLALFDRTRGLFEGWLRTTTALAFTPMLLVLGGSGVLASLSPVIAAIADDPAAAVADLRPIMTLFLGAIVYALLLIALAWTAVSLTRGWSLKLGRGEPSSSPATPGGGHAHDARPTVGSTATTTSNPVQADGRVSDLIAAVLRDATPAEAGRVVITPPPVADLAPRPGSAVPVRARVEGLGQSFRPAVETRALTGTIGS